MKETEGKAVYLVVLLRIQNFVVVHQHHVRLVTVGSLSVNRHAGDVRVRSVNFDTALNSGIFQRVTILLRLGQSTTTGRFSMMSSEAARRRSASPSDITSFKFSNLFWRSKKLIFTPYSRSRRCAF
jgi:hypothetical protein